MSHSSVLMISFFNSPLVWMLMMIYFIRWIWYLRSELKNLDPFLMLDHFSGTTKYNLPYWLKRTFVDFYSCTTTIQFHFSVLCYVCVFDFAVSPPGGFPDHPHRGSYSILTTHLIMIIIIYNFIALLKGLALLYFDLHLFCRFWDRHLHARGIYYYILITFI